MNVSYVGGVLDTAHRSHVLPISNKVIQINVCVTHTNLAEVPLLSANVIPLPGLPA